MNCTNCKIDKLSREFPSDTIGKNCFHMPSFCLRCIIENLDVKKSKLICPECKGHLSDQEIKKLNLAWENAPFKIDPWKFSTITQRDNLNNLEKGEFFVVLLNGTKLQFRLDKIKTVVALKEAIEEQTNVEVKKQRLIYKDVELHTHSRNAPNQLSEYSIVTGSHLQFMVLLYSISKELSINELTFDLNWGYSSCIVDFLDGTCMLYTGSCLWRIFDYSKKRYDDIPHMSHSGDVLDSNNKRANLAFMPATVTKLYFVLSSFGSPDIGSVKDPSFKLFDPSNPNVQLCSYTLKSAAKSRAVIVCVVEKSRFGNWNIFEIGKLSDGYADNYTPITNTIKDMNDNYYIS
ncbi:16237_t:CDS:2 [Funneliformis caledonium]|uniref:16237_t:CDS:1 n=1 Tax=Funneliformis caledonium TaxID=1117310 RepID=A0A9N9FYF1_9GLOM|nr:16237_t:CDS:2 [Funneliformis caledonium]